MRNIILLFAILIAGVAKAQTSTMTMTPRVIKGVFYAPTSDDAELIQRSATFSSVTHTDYGGYVWNYQMDDNEYILRFEYNRYACSLPSRPNPCTDDEGVYYIVIRTPHDSSRVLSFKLDPQHILRPIPNTIVYSGSAQVWQHDGGSWGFDQFDTVAIEAVFRK